MGRTEIAALVLVLAVVVGTPAAAFAYDAGRGGGGDVHEVTLVGAHGTWSPSVVHVRQGETVRLRVTSHDVVHGLAVAGYPVVVPQVYPGKTTVVEFVADEAGTFPFMCIIVCSPQHATMTGELVVDAAS